MKKTIILTETKFKELREKVLNMIYKDIVKIYPRYVSKDLQLTGLNLNMGQVSGLIYIYDLKYLYHHIISNYNNLSYSLQLAISNLHINATNYDSYIFLKTYYLRNSFILWLTLFDSIKKLFNKILNNPKDFYEKIKVFPDFNKIIEKYSDNKHSKENTKYLNFKPYKSFPIFEKNKWNMTFRDFANDCKHNDNLLFNLEYEILNKSPVKYRVEKENTYSFKKMTKFDEFCLCYEMCIENLIEATNDIVEAFNKSFE